MNWDQLEGKWKQVKGGVRKQWGKLTDDDLEYMSGSKDQFIGRLQERYGLAREDAQTQADKWLQAQAEDEKTLRSGGGRQGRRCNHKNHATARERRAAGAQPTPQENFAPIGSDRPADSSRHCGPSRAAARPAGGSDKGERPCPPARFAFLR